MNKRVRPRATRTVGFGTSSELTTDATTTGLNPSRIQKRVVMLADDTGADILGENEQGGEVKVGVRGGIDGGKDGRKGWMASRTEKKRRSSRVELGCGDHGG